MNEYEGGRLPLFHFDMYRLNSADDLFDIGWEDYLSRGGVCAVEKVGQKAVCPGGGGQLAGQQCESGSAEEVASGHFHSGVLLF